MYVSPKKLLTYRGANYCIHQKYDLVYELIKPVQTVDILRYHPQLANLKDAQNIKGGNTKFSMIKCTATSHKPHPGPRKITSLETTSPHDLFTRLGATWLPFLARLVDSSRVQIAYQIFAYFTMLELRCIKFEAHCRKYTQIYVFIQIACFHHKLVRCQKILSETYIFKYNKNLRDFYRMNYMSLIQTYRSVLF